MSTRLLSLAGLLGLLAISIADATAPTTKPGDDRSWNASDFGYTRPKHMVVEQTTPTADQVNFFRRPAQMPEKAIPPKNIGPARPRVVESVNAVRLRFVDADGQIVPALLCTPIGKSGPFPLVIATHGLGSWKAQVCAQVAGPLTARGFAVLAADMPAHGEQRGDSLKDNPLAQFKLFQEAVVDVRQEIDAAEQLPQVTTKGGVVLVGYSMGSWISAQAGPADSRVRALVLMVGGVEPRHLPRAIESAAPERDPRLSLAHFAGRPILMLNGKHDNIVPPDTARQLFDSLKDPKKQVWYDSGHVLPPQAYRDAANWISKLPPATTQP